MKTIASILAMLSASPPGFDNTYEILEFKRALEEMDDGRIEVEDGVCISLFSIQNDRMYELLWYEFNLSLVPDPKASMLRVEWDERENREGWHERLLKVSPVFVKEGTKDVSKSVFLKWIDYVLNEPEIPEELRRVYGKEVRPDELYLCFY